MTPSLPRAHLSGLYLLVALVTSSVSHPAGAGSTQSFFLASAEAFEKGEVDGTAVRSDGRLTRGVHTDRFGLDEALLAYSLFRLPNGIAIGTGNEGRIYLLSGDRVSLLAETEAAVVTSLAAGPPGVLYAGTLPGGKIMAVDISNRRAQSFAAPEGVEHVWALAYDAPRKRLYAATGPSGKIFAIDPQGRSTLHYQSDAQHVMSLALDEDGTLYAGTSDDALVLRIVGPNRAQVVQDLPGNEVTALAIRNGIIAATANTFPDPKQVGGDTTQSITTKLAMSNSSQRRPQPGKGQVWRIGNDGRAEVVLSLDKNHFASVQVDGEGVIFAGTGQDGRIYRIDPDGSHALWIDVPERQVLALDVSGSEPTFVTSDSAAVYRIHQRSTRAAYWTSAPLDTRFGARWGRLTWRARGQIEIQTRSGNTSKPDATWSAWSKPIQAPGITETPEGRFLQVRARLLERAEIYAMTAYYLPHNQRAQVRDISLQQDGHTETKPSETSSNGNNKPRPLPTTSSTYQIRWKVHNLDADNLRYRLFYRQEGQRQWRPILRESEILKETEYRWETSSIPDDHYRIRIVASDELDNPEERALEHEALSTPFRIDNHAPGIEGLRYANGVLRGRAIDTLGPITRLEYAVNGNEWQIFFPDDGVLDSRIETFTLSLSTRVEPGTHIVAVRATDAAGNTGSAERVVEVAKR